MKNIPERRKNYPRLESQLYQLASIDDYIMAENRLDELDRLIEVKEQKKVWKRTIVASLMMTGIFIILAIWGLFR